MENNFNLLSQLLNKIRLGRVTVKLTKTVDGLEHFLYENKKVLSGKIDEDYFTVYTRLVNSITAQGLMKIDDCIIFVDNENLMIRYMFKDTQFNITFTDTGTTIE